MITTSTNVIRSFLLLALLSAFAWGQPGSVDAAKQVSVTSNGAVLRVNVVSTVSLTQVLQALCMQQKVECAGTESLVVFAVPSMTIEGTFLQVAETLLQGTEMNYSFSRGESGMTIRLAILGKASTGGSEVAGVGRELQAGAMASEDSGLLEMPRSSEAPEPESPEDTARTEAVLRHMFGAGSPNAAPNQDQAATAAGSGPATESQVPQHQPFPDEFGNPVPATTSGASEVQPFPDHHGNPIPITPNPAQGSPFPPTSR